MRRSSNESSSIPRPAAKGSPNKTSLSLRRVIGTSTTTANGFSLYDSGRQFAFCAGSTTVLAEVDDRLTVSQRFFRARTTVPTSSSISASQPASHIPVSAAQGRPRALSAAGLPRGTPMRNGSFGYLDLGAPSAASARDRVKTITCVALSPNGKFIAAGETGYSPRVLIFSTASDPANDTPLSVLTEHTFGVKSIAFSPDSQYLATLGDINDGFLNIWAINPKTGAAKLHSTNRCTSVVKGMCFVGNTLVTVGVRHVKAWKLDDSSPVKPKFSNDIALPLTPLAGRNCVLGSFGDSTFTCVTSSKNNEAIVCTESGAILLYDDSRGHQKLQCCHTVSFGISSVAYDSRTDRIWIGGRAHNLESFKLDELRGMVVSKPASPTPSDGSSRPSSSHDKLGITCIGLLPDALITIDSMRSLRVSPADAAREAICDDTFQAVAPARDAVMGVAPLAARRFGGPEFFTWSAGGLVTFWDCQGNKHDTHIVPLEQSAAEEDQNELKVVRASRSLEFFVTGDKHGLLRLYSGKHWHCILSVRAHSSEITDIAICEDEDTCLIATCGRDRAVQLFKKVEDDLHLKQTLEDHVGSVNRVLFLQQGEKLLSCSTDRTIVIRERAVKKTDCRTQVAYFATKVITMKPTPVSMEACADDPDSIIVSSTDRHVHQYSISSGRSLNSFRAGDSETGEAVVMNSLSICEEIPGLRPRTLVGLCSTDKSLRVYDLHKGTILSGEFGHTEGVTDVTLLEDEADADNARSTLISTGMDGIIMIWDLTFKTPSADGSLSPPKEDGSVGPKSEAVRLPLRRVISKSEMLGFQTADGQSPMASPNARDNSPARTLRTKSSRTSLKNHSQPSRIVSNPPAPPLPLARLSLGVAVQQDRSPSPVRQRRHSGSANDMARYCPVSYVRNNPAPTSAPRSETTSRRPGVRRPSMGRPPPTSDSTGAAPAQPAAAAAAALASAPDTTEQIIKSLKAYREQLDTTTEAPRGDRNDLEVELKLTLKALEERAKSEKSKHSGGLHFPKRLSSITRRRANSRSAETGS